MTHFDNSKIRYDKFAPDDTDMLQTAIKYNGNISAIADHYNVTRDTVYQYMNRDPVGKSIISQVRGYNKETMLDLAEHVVRYNLHNYKTNAGLAQRAAEKVIDRLGYLRGWLSEKVAETDENKEFLAQKFEEILAQLNQEDSSNRKIDDNSINNETKS